MKNQKLTKLQLINILSDPDLIIENLEIDRDLCGDFINGRVEYHGYTGRETITIKTFKLNSYKHDNPTATE